MTLIDAVTAVIAAIPILLIFAGMLKLKLPSHKAGIISLGLGILLAFFVWKMSPVHILQSVLEGVMLGLWPILWVIFTAIYTYNLLIASGAIGKIKTMLSRVSMDKRVQVLIIAFAFGGVLEATAGFGTAVAIPASILIALGFEPVFASVVCLVANTIPVAFGVVGIPVITLAKVTDLRLDSLTLYTALQLLPFVLLLPLVLVTMTAGRIKGIRGMIPMSIAGGAAFGVGQTLVAWLVGPELSAVAGSLFALAVLIFWGRAFPTKNTMDSDDLRQPAGEPEEKIGIIEGIKAWCPYIFIIAAVLITRTVPFLNFLNKYPFELSFRFYSGPGGKPMTFSLVTSPGTIILVSSILGGVVQGVTFKIFIGTAKKTLKQISKTSITVLSIVSLAKLIGYSGMISSIAFSLAAVTGRLYPLISPLIGALGTFITGSDTSSNVLFGELQKQTAVKIGSDAAWIAAANASGATAGKMISPQSIAIATSAAGLSGKEGEILEKTIRYSLVFVVLLGILVYIVDII